MSDGPLKGKRALVTGGTRGIGFATVKALAEAGARVVFTGTGSSGVGEAREKLSAYGLVEGIVCDVTDRARMVDLVAEADIVVNNAALAMPVGLWGDLDPEAVARMFAVNITAPAQVAQAAIPGMVSRGGGTIINISSGAAGHIMARSGPYCVSKAALAMLTQALHADYGDAGLRVFGFRPGMVGTDMQDEIIGSGHFPDWPSRERFLQPEMPARVVAWLCTAEADHLTGQEFSIIGAEVAPALSEADLAAIDRAKNG